MPTTRVEAFSDGVLAIIITIMVLELKVPEGHDLSALISTTGLSVLTYMLSFVYIGIYWNNHHHLFQATEHINGTVLWANLHLLFWLSLLPFSTAWMDDSSLARTPVVVYGITLLGAALAYVVVPAAIIRAQGPDSTLKRVLDKDRKGKISLVLHFAGVACALLGEDHGGILIDVGVAFYVIVAVLWLIPDRQIEHDLNASAHGR